MEQIRKPLIVRAYELARSGRFASNDQIRSELTNEGYAVADIEDHFSEALFNRDLDGLRKFA